MNKPVALSDALHDPRYWIKVDDLKIHKRFSRPLVSDGITHVFDILQKGEAELLAVSWFGPSGLTEVKAALADLGLALENQVDLPIGDHAAEIAAARARFASATIPEPSAKPDLAAQSLLSPSARIGTKLLRDAGLNEAQVAMITDCPQLRDELATFFRAAAALTERLGTMPLASMMKRPDNIVVGLKLLGQDDRSP